MRRSMIARSLTRRRFLQGVGHGALLTPLLGSRLARAACDPLTSPCELRLVATDGAFALPGRTQLDSATVPGQPFGPLYGFGFVQGGFLDSIADLTLMHKGLVQWPAPTASPTSSTAADRRGS